MKWLEAVESETSSNPQHVCAKETVEITVNYEVKTKRNMTKKGCANASDDLLSARNPEKVEFIN